MKRLGMVLHRAVVGVFLCQLALGAVVAVGWVYALMQRTTLRAWWRSGVQAGNGGHFEQFAEADEATRALAAWPRWFGSKGAALFRHARRGLAALLTTTVVTAPATVAWAFAWYSGWDNSFNKGYEQFWVGPVVGWLGILAFVLAMLYVPIAQAHHAASGSWRAFFDVRTVWKLMTARMLAWTGLAAAYAACSLPIMFLRVAPAFFGQSTAVSSMSAQEVGRTLSVYYLVATPVLFGALIALRMLAARIYAGAVLRGLRTGRLSGDALADFEREQLERMGHLPVVETPARPGRVRWAATVVGAGAASMVAGLFWLGFVAQIFVLEFFNYHSVWGWLNQPLVHLPWIRFIP